MGFGVVGATALLATSVMVSGYALTNAWLNTQSDLREARFVADSLAQDALQSQISVDDVQWSVGGIVIVTASNAGPVTFDITEVDVLLEGILEDGGAMAITQHGGTLLHPNEELVITLTQVQLGGRFLLTSPTRASVATGTGALGFWGV